MIAAELCAGAGATALGLEAAGFEPGVLVELDADCCKTLRLNRPAWPVFRADITADDARLTGDPVDLLSAGLPCTPHSRAGKQLGEADERHLWDAAIRIIGQGQPRAIMLETTSDIMSALFDVERNATADRLRALGYFTRWEVLDALWYGLSQRRERALLVGFREPVAAAAFRWPAPDAEPPPTVGQLLFARMAARGWRGAAAWRDQADDLAPTVVGGSHKHTGGPDLGPTQSRAAWARLGVNGSGLADDVPDASGRYQRGARQVFDAAEAGVMLTLRCAADIQAFPPDWHFHGTKATRYGQVGNAWPPPAARAVGEAVRAALEA